MVIRSRPKVAGSAYPFQNSWRQASGPPPFIIDAAAADMIVDRLGEAVDAALEGVPPS